MAGRILPCRSIPWLLTLLALVSGCVFAQSCSVSNRVDCGYVGIDQDQCQQKGCCWSPVSPNPNNLPYCFFTSAGPPTPSCNADRARNDCGYLGVTQSQCQQKGCCWSPVSPNPGNLPYCFYSNPLVLGYKVVQYSTTQTGFQLNLSLANGTAAYGTDITPLTVIVTEETDTRVHVKIVDPSNARWEVPQKIIPRPTVTTKASNPKYTVSYTNYPFGFAITRTTDGSVLFNTTVPSNTADSAFNGLIYEDQYLEISTQLPSNANLYGLMEETRPTGFRIPNNYMATLWNIDTPASTTNQNLYGSHPFYLQMLSNGNAHGVLLLNSNGMDIVVQDNSLTYRTIGGVLDFYIFVGPSPDSVISQYTALVGLPHIPPYWALGFHQSKYGYPNIQYVEQVVANYTAAKIPLDTIWNDIDYMDEYEDFTFDPVNYPVSQVQQFVQQLHSNNQQYVVIIDPGIKIEGSYASYNALVNSGAFIKDANGNAFSGKVWPGYTIFPDFFHPNALSFWSGQISSFLATVPVDGLWIDMNEISNFCQGECNGTNPQFAINSKSFFEKSDKLVKSAFFSATSPPYAINNQGGHNALNVKTLDMNAVHYTNVLEYNAHNLFGLTEAIATKTALESTTGRRSFVLSRSTFVSSGKWTAHWTGDNTSTFNDLYWSILGLLNFNILGIPNIGSDICGFNGDTTEELCTRWIQVGAFYTFSRDHDSINSVSQELYRWPQVASVSQTVLGIRYSILSQFYTLFYFSATQGTPVIRPLFFQFPKDQNTFAIDQQFLIGRFLMVSPVLQQGATSVRAYFPDGVWYDYYTYSRLSVPTGGGYLTLSAPITFVPLHILGGSITTIETPELTTAATRLNPFSLLIAPDANGKSTGDLYVDDGVSLFPNIISSNAYTLSNFTAVQSGAKGYVQSQVLKAGYKGSQVNMSLTSVVALAVPSQPSSVTINGSPISSWSYNGSVQSLTISSLSLRVDQTFQISW
eukprot:CAMPEP_0184341240 /NCGR_PEP_ID=MMETSP1089-20130417/9855_1 /TAXON_ID=38269 ORGANISM="Gloeochaete wittrockiana, Strain SAG46.84" /NCGR_SAMPLE_ID=MMETSP1089 /ASSEMBLY_ACC=CAM_ASM_000445 /LENGTH=975 /DNA_ID=CAMNT_0026669427 /DNA_START=135 /DNA_END=3059 /DNA_ORIENTATION=+